MKKQRIFLHTLILVLAAACFGTAAYGWTKYANVKAKNEYRWEYQDQYETLVTDSMQDIVAQYLYIKNFSDNKKVLVKSSEYGNLTAKDIKKLYKNEDKKNEFYNKLYDLESTKNDDEIFMTDQQNNQYKYYKKAVKYIAEYEDIQDFDAVKSMIYDKSNIPEINSARDGLNYEIMYTDGENSHKITTSNNLSDNNKYRDYCIIENGAINPLENKGIMENFNMYIEDMFENASGEGGYETSIYLSDRAEELWVNYYDDVKDFPKALIECSFAVDKTDSGYLNKLHANYEKAPSNLSGTKKSLSVIVLMCGIYVLVAFVLYLLLMVQAGHKEKGDKPLLNKSDKLWWDVEVFVAFIACFIAIIPLSQNVYYNWKYEEKTLFKILLVGTGIASLVAVELTVLLSESFARRIKCKTFWKTTLIGKIFYGIKKIINYLLLNVKTSILVIAFGITSFIWCSMAILGAYNEYTLFVPTLMIIIIIVVVCAFVLIFFKEYDSITEGTKKISEGNLDYKIEDEYKFKLNRSLKESINNIGDGLSKAVAESVKNERTKTELITNVSHDLKTPLTSIINYVDLLKRENIENEKAKDYIRVLDEKSQRLKQLTEDLVEASKISSGNIKLEFMNLNLNELVQQVNGEFAERFESRNLDLICILQPEPLLIRADSRRIWRVLENLYVNVCKYAMPGTRVYVDAIKKDGKIQFSIKNISENPLNFQADELTERFIRGDVSRSTEGSGLGLSIAKNLTVLQHGSFNIYLDGDLFKVTITFDEAVKEKKPMPPMIVPEAVQEEAQQDA